MNLEETVVQKLTRVVQRSLRGKVEVTLERDGTSAEGIHYVVQIHSADNSLGGLPREGNVIIKQYGAGFEVAYADGTVSAAVRGRNHGTGSCELETNRGKVGYTSPGYALDAMAILVAKSIH